MSKENFADIENKKNLFLFYLRLNKRCGSPLKARVRIEGKVKFRGLPLLPYAELKPPVKIFYFLFKLFLRFVGRCITSPQRTPKTDWEVHRRIGCLTLESESDTGEE